MLGLLVALPSLKAPAATSRRAVLGAASSVVFAAPAFAAEKGYITLDEYNKKKAEAKKDEALYGQFESLRERAAQTGEFDKLAEKGDFSGISNLARNWDASIRKEVLEVAMKSLDGSDRKKGEALNNAVLDDCKKLNKLAQAGAKDDVPAASAALRGHVEEFYQLEPRRIQEKFGLSDL